MHRAFNFLSLALVVAVASTAVLSAGVPLPSSSRLLMNKGAGRIGGSERAACTESYAPCTCNNGTNGLEISCINTPIADIEQVFFDTKALELYSVTLKATTTTGTIDLTPDLLADKRVKNLYMYCPVGVTPKATLTILSTTFEFTRRVTERLEIHDCDMVNQADMAFLDGFSVLSSLHFENIDNIGVSFITLPASTMPLLTELVLSGTTGLDAVAVDFPDVTPARLQRLVLDRSQLGDAAVRNILISVGASSSASSLQELSIADNLITAVPRIGSFSQLNSLNMSNDNDELTEGNSITTIAQSAIIFSAPVSFVGLSNVGVTTIADGAFVGDYTKAQVNLEYNKLVAFTPGAFKTMLEQMTVQPPEVAGQVIVTQNPFDCGCGLAWLIRDNANLISSVKNGVCGGFFRFEDLNPDSYATC